MSTPDYLTVTEAAEILRSSRAFVLRELNRKNLRGTKLNGVGWRITRADVDNYMDAKANVSRVRRAS